MCVVWARKGGCVSGGGACQDKAPIKGMSDEGGAERDVRISAPCYYEQRRLAEELANFGADELCRSNPGRMHMDMRELPDRFGIFSQIVLFGEKVLGK